MKRKFILAALLIILAVVAAGACFFYVGDLYTYRSPLVLTLKDFSDDNQLRAGPANLVVVAFWEGSTGAAEGEPVAVIPYTFPYDSGFTFCWEVGSETYDEYMVLHFAGGRELLRVDAGGDCVTEILPSAAYEMKFYRDDVTSLFPIFIRPYPESAYSWFDPYDPPEPRQFNITTNECRGCTLSNGDYYQANFVECDLTDASFISAYLYRADLTDAVIDGAVFDGANLSLATWTDGRTCAEGSTGSCD